MDNPNTNCSQIQQWAWLADFPIQMNVGEVFQLFRNGDITKTLFLQKIFGHAAFIKQKVR